MLAAWDQLRTTRFTEAMRHTGAARMHIRGSANRVEGPLRSFYADLTPFPLD